MARVKYAWGERLEPFAIYHVIELGLYAIDK